MKYRVVITTTAKEQIDNASNYIARVFCDTNAAINLQQDFYETALRLGSSPFSHRKYIDGRLEGYYKVNLSYYHYVILYQIYKNMVVIEEFHHMSENYEQ